MVAVPLLYGNAANTNDRNAACFSANIRTRDMPLAAVPLQGIAFRGWAPTDVEQYAQYALDPEDVGQMTRVLETA